MHSECPLCGRNMENHGWYSKYANDPQEIRQQIENLDQILESLQNGGEDIKELIDDRLEMCPMCVEIFEGVVNEKDIPVVERRINQAILFLEERAEQMLPGQL